MAEVWVARRSLGTRGAKFVALKLIADHYVGDERYNRMFQAEAELAAILSHANIVQVFDEGADRGRSYLVMEWVDGLNLLKLGAVLALVDDDDRRFHVTSYIIGQLLYALGYAHSITSFDGSPLGVVHRDVSPQNVLVSNHGEVKLTDFGVAYHVMEESSGIHVKGKVRYMAPEQLGGKSRSPTVDLFAVGALLHELLDGKKFRGDYEDGREMFTAVLSGHIPPLTRPAPPALDQLRLRLLAPDPAERIQTADEALQWLKRYPGHGDARSELTKLCGSLTGVVRPRAGPGQSGQMPMAEMRTAQFKNRGLAKPQIANAVQLAAPPPIQPPAAPDLSKLRTRPLVKPPREAPAPVSASASSNKPSQTPVITGQTQCLKPQQLVGGLAATPAPHSHPPPRAVAPPPLPVAAAQPPPAPVRPPSSQPKQPQLPPTERLGLSETSSPVPGGTEVVDPRAILAALAPTASATDHDIVPVFIEGDGTDTSQRQLGSNSELLHPTGPHRPVRRGPTFVLIGIGLLVIGLSSAAITWALATSAATPSDATKSAEQNMATVASRPADDVVVAAPETPAPKQPEFDAESEPVVEAQPDPPPAPDDASAQGQVPATDDDELVIDPEPPATPDDAPSETSTDEPPTYEPSTTPQPLAPQPTTSSDQPPPAIEAAPPKKGRVVIKPVSSATKAYEVKIASKTITVGLRKQAVKLRPGKKRVQWRRSPKDHWKSGPSINLKSEDVISLLVVTSGIKRSR